MRSEEEQPVPYPALKCATDKTVAVLLILFLSPDLFRCLLDFGARHAVHATRQRMLAVPGAAHLARARVRPAQVPNAAGRRARRDASSCRHARLEEADPGNLTWVGRHLLKRWYLDELPQLTNVLCGEMSLVGPRPWPVSMVKEQVAEGHGYRHLIRAGLTGLAQVSKGAPDRVNYTRLDLAYVEACRTRSSGRLLCYDLAILYQTVRVILRGEGLNY